MTHPLPFDAASELPWLTPQTALAILLHPQALSASSPSASKLGGLFLWPQDEPWPVCRHVPFVPPEWGIPAEQHDYPFEALLQLRREDFPELPFPGDRDLLQLLWCPQHHDEEGCRVRWRRADDVTRPLLAMPAIPPFPGRTPLRECTFRPERLQDYPSLDDLDHETKRFLAAWTPPAVSPNAAEERTWLEQLFDQATLSPRGPGINTYQAWIAAAPGLKLLGHPAWLQSSEDLPQCEAGHTMSMLFQMESTGLYDDGDERWGKPSAAPHGVTIHDCGRMYFFACFHCEARPVQARLQSL